MRNSVIFNETPPPIQMHHTPPETTTAALHAPAVVVVPEWIALAFHRNNLNLIELLNYGSIRKVLSIEDMAQFYSINCVSETTNQTLSVLGNFLINEIFRQHGITPQQEKEVKEIIHPLAMADSTLAEVLARLCLNEPSVSGSVRNNFLEEGASYHKVVSLHDGVSAFIIKRGFLDAIRNRSYALKVASDHLKVLYSNDTIQSVSSSRPFAHYLKLLGNLVR